jgi:glycosyltransferase involved in cell wall biosynthesis
LTIESLLRENYPALEIFLVDGGSVDQSLNVIKQYANRFKWWVSEPDGGQSSAINKGFARSNGQLMAWLNSDDMITPGTLQFVASFFAKHPEVDAVYGHRILIDENDMEIGRWILPPHDDEVLKWADFVPQETLFWRRSIWEKIGGAIDESFAFAMDWDLLLRFREAGAHIVRLPKFMGLFRVHNQQKTSCALENTGWKEMQRLRLRHIGFPPSDSMVARQLAWYIGKAWALELAWQLGLIRYE